MCLRNRSQFGGETVPLNLTFIQEESRKDIKKYGNIIFRVVKNRFNIAVTMI